MVETVTPRQLEILRFIRDFRTRVGYSPTMQEIGDQLGLTKVTVFEHAAALEKKGLLRRGAKHRARSLQVSPKFEFPDERSTKISLVGRIAAGAPIEAIEDRRSLDLEAMFAAGQSRSSAGEKGAEGERFALEVNGDSMIDDHIQPGDFVICDRRNTPRNGEMVVALLEDGEATLKRFYREKDRIRLQPANVNYKPIYTTPGKIAIQGVVVGVIRKM